MTGSVAPITKGDIICLYFCPTDFWLAKHGIQPPKGAGMPLWKKLADCEAVHLTQDGLPPGPDGPIAGRLVRLNLGRPVHKPTMLELRAVPDRCLLRPAGDYAPLDQKTKPYPVKLVPAHHRLELSYYGLAMSLANLSVADVGYLLPYSPEYSGGSVRLLGTTLACAIALAEAEQWLRLARAIMDLAEPPSYDFLAEAAKELLHLPSFPQQWEECEACTFVHQAARYVV